MHEADRASHWGQVWAYGCLRHEHAGLLQAAEARALAVMSVRPETCQHSCGMVAAIRKWRLTEQGKQSSRAHIEKGLLHFICHGSVDCVSKDVNHTLVCGQLS